MRNRGARRVAVDTVALCVLLMLTATYLRAGQAEFAQAVVAQVGDIWGAARQDSTVTRQDGTHDRAVPGLSLYPGDIVRIVPCTPMLEIIFADMDRPGVRLPDPQCEYRVTRSPPMAPPRALGSLLQGIFGLLYSHLPPPRPIPTYSQGTDSAAQGTGGLLGSAPGIAWDALLRRRAALLTQVEQKLSSATRSLFVLWNPVVQPPYRLTLTQHDAVVAMREVPADVDAVLELPTALHANEAATLTVVAGDRIVTTIAIAVVDPAAEPLADGLPPAARDDPRAATLQGLWLLAKGGPEWRLQAMAHLQASADVNGDFQAARVLRALISGEWEPPRD
jgi:hypothetical protein